MILKFTAPKSVGDKIYQLTMGIKDLISKIFPADLKVESTFEVLRNKTMGVDVSNYMFKLITTRDNLVRDFHSDPRLDLSAYIDKYWDSFKKICDSFGIKLVLVLDGKRNFAKSETNVVRESKRDESIVKLETLLLNGDQDDSEKVLKLQKSTVFISEDMLYSVKIWGRKNDVVCIQSLYEADAGLQHLEDMGLTDGTFSEDGDFFPLNSKLWATKVSIAKGTLVLYNSEQVRATLGRRLVPDRDLVMTADHGRVLSVLLGSDFLSRPPGFGPKTVEAFVAKWMVSSIEDNEASLLQIETSCKKRKLADIAENLNNNSDYSRKFWLAFNMLKHPPVFKFTSLALGSTVNTGLLGIADTSLSKEFVLTKLGFDALENVSELGDLRKLLFLEDNVFIRTMRPLLPILQPRNAQGLLLPWGCNHNFNKWPPKMCTSDMLNKWLRARNVRYSPAVDHSDLVTAVVALLIEVPQRDIVPLDEIPDEADFDVEPGGVKWNSDGEFCFSKIRDLRVTPLIDNTFIEKIFGRRGGVENRAIRLIVGGHFDLTTVKSSEIKCKVSGNNLHCTMFQIKSIPSMKANAYEVNLIFRAGVNDSDETGDRFIKSPFSHCDCPAGQMFCSHMLGFLGIIRIIQKKVLMSHINAIDLFPESVKALSSTGILLEYVY